MLSKITYNTNNHTKLVGHSQHSVAILIHSSTILELGIESGQLSSRAYYCMSTAASNQASVTFFTTTARQLGRPLNKKAAEKSIEMRGMVVDKYTGQPSSAESSQRVRETARVHTILRILFSDGASRIAGPECCMVTHVRYEVQSSPCSP